MSTQTDRLVTICVGCGVPMDEDLPSFQESVNLTPDMLFIGSLTREFEKPLVELDVAFDWCSLDCFGRTLFRAAVDLGWRPRP